MRRDLSVRYDFSPVAAFRSIDRYNEGIINANNLSAFLKQCGHFAHNLELMQIIRRMDANGDGYLTYHEFTDFLSSSSS